MHNSQTELEIAIEVLRNLPGSRLQSAKIGLLEHEMQYGLGDLAHDGLDGEVRLSFEDCPPVYISWAGTPSQDRDGGNCTQIRESTFHRNIPYVVAPDACVLSHAVGQRLTKCRVFGYASDPLVFQLSFQGVVTLIGNFTFDDTVYIRGVGPSNRGGAQYGDLLWDSGSA